jgi:succinate dehydrogenase flavin-adding protein (antitoxin of CptAB toxin-antitoxin module)
MSLRALYSTAGKGRGEIAEVLSTRATSLPNRAASTIQKTLSPEKQRGNILNWFGKSTKQLKDAEGDEYKKVFERFKDDLNPSATEVLYNALNRQVVELLQQQKNLRPAIINLIQTSKQAPLFKVTKAGKVELLRDVDLETAEIIRRSLNDQTTAAFNKGEGALGTALGDLEKTLRKKIDDVSPELANTRARWAKIMARSDAFEQGKKILSKSADEVEIIFNDLAAKGDDEAIAALRAGYASALRNKRTVGSQTTLFRDLNDLDKKQRMILETIFPGDDLNKAINQINLADRALKTANRVLGGSPTAPQRAAESKIGTMSLAANVVDMFLRPMSAPFAAMRILRDIVGTKLDNLSAEQRTEVAKMLVSEDPEILEKMLTDKTVLAKLSQKYNEMIDAFGTGARRATAQQIGSDLESEDSRSIKAIVQSATPKTKEKLRAIGVE